MSIQMTQQDAYSYVGTEVIVESNSMLTKGIAASIEVRDDFVFLSLKDTSWKSGSLETLHVGQWNASTSQPTSPILLSAIYESLIYGNAVLAPSPQGTRALLSSE